MTRREFWELFDVPGAEDAAASLDHTLGYAITVMKSELKEGAGRLEAFRVAYSILWFALLHRAGFGGFDTPVRETAWQQLLQAAVPVLGYVDPNSLHDAVESWGRLQP